MTSKPTGTVTFLFTDIEDSTRLAREHPQSWEAARAQHHAILRAAIEDNNGFVFQIVGDAFCSAFHKAADALKAAIKAQQDLQYEPWSEFTISVRMGIHTGEAEIYDDEYLGYTTLSFVQRLMSAGHGRQILVSSSTENLLREQLPNQIGLRDMGKQKFAGVPSPVRVFQVYAPDLPSEFPPLRSLEGLPNNLPAQLTSFVGREKELRDVKSLLQNAHMLTLIGPGGTGKTRLSIQAARDMSDRYPDGVWFVEFAPILDPLLVPHATAITLGLREEPQRPIIDTLCDFLRDKKMLLILDNCEHLVDACATMADRILHAASATRILASSRETLGIDSEVTYRVPSMELPDVNHLPPVETMSQYEAVQLFIERATSAVSTFTITKSNAPALAQVCYHLDGIPLAIELAAAKIRVLSVEQIAERLDDRFKLLTGRSRTVLERHQTLRAAIDWSYNLLPPAEQILFQRLSVFVGGWTLEAAESVCEDGLVRSEDVLHLLEQLINKSLVIAEVVEHESRYHMLETIQQYAREKLTEGGESELLRGRHLGFFLAIALTFERGVHGNQAKKLMKRVNAEHDNLREAMNWAGESGQVQSGLRLGFALHYYWLLYGYWSLGRESLERLLTRPEAAEHTIARADALSLAGDLATQQGDLKAARALLEESKAIGMELGAVGKPSLGWATMLLGQSWMGHDKVRAQRELDQSIAILREAGESWRVAIAVLVRGNLAESQGDLVHARKLFGESLALLRSIGDTFASALSTYALGRIFYYQREYAKASVHLQQALEVMRTSEENTFIWGALGFLGSIALLKGNGEQAIMYFEERLAKVRELMNKTHIANALCDLGIALGHLGNYARATALLNEGLELSRETGNKYLTAACLTGLASIQQLPRQTAQLVAAAQAAFERSGEFINPLYRNELERTENKIREVLDEEDFAKFSAEGGAMTVEQAIAFALGTREQ